MWDMRLKIWKDMTFQKQYKEAGERKQEDRNYETKNDTDRESYNRRMVTA